MTENEITYQNIISKIDSMRTALKVKSIAGKYLMMGEEELDALDLALSYKINPFNPTSLNKELVNSEFMGFRIKKVDEKRHLSVSIEIKT